MGGPGAAARREPDAGRERAGWCLCQRHGRHRLQHRRGGDGALVHPSRWRDRRAARKLGKIAARSRMQARQCGRCQWSRSKSFRRRVRRCPTCQGALRYGRMCAATPAAGRWSRRACPLCTHPVAEGPLLDWGVTPAMITDSQRHDHSAACLDRTRLLGHSRLINMSSSAGPRRARQRTRPFARSPFWPCWLRGASVEPVLGNIVRTVLHRVTCWRRTKL